MFTGIVEACVAVQSWERRGSGARLVLPAPAGWQAELGESLAVCGACLTVADRPAAGGSGRVARSAPAALAFDLTAETLARTWFEELEPGRLVNLERALLLSDRVGGHLVSGHVDGLASVVAIADEPGGGRRLSFEVADGLERYLVDKGSITLDGVSLTVVEPRGSRFDVALVPHTLAATNLGRARMGQRVNVEADLIGKWVERLIRSPGTGC